MKTSDEEKRARAQRRADNRARGETRDYPRVRARRVVPGARVKITKACHEHAFFFALAPPKNPTDERLKNVTPEEIRNFIGYCYGISMLGLGIQLHAAVMMSNHHHTDITDTRGEYPLFKKRLHSHLGKGTNALHNRFGKVWEDKKCDTVVVDEECLDDLVYTLTNPVASALVKWSELWPSFTTAGWKVGEVHKFKRPRWYFDEDGDLPDEVEVKIEMPKVFEGKLTPAEYDEILARRVRAESLTLHDELKAAGRRRFLGVKKVIAQRWGRAHESKVKRFTVIPTISGRRSDPRWHAALEQNEQWEREYAAARERFLAGDEDVVFPYGTYWLPRYAGAKVADAPS